MTTKHERLLQAFSGFGRHPETGWPIHPNPIVLRAALRDFEPEGDLEAEAFELVQLYLEDDFQFREDESNHRRARELTVALYQDAGFPDEDMRPFFPDIFSASSG